MAVKDNEGVYDGQVAPLMTQIISICKEHGIPVVASFEYAPEQFCTTVILTDASAANLKAAANMIQRGFAAFAVTTRASEPKAKRAGKAGAK